MQALNKGFTLTEIVVVVLVFGVGVGLFNTVFINNWTAYEDRIARANLWTESNLFFEQLSFDGRNAQKVALATTADAKTATFTNNINPNLNATFSITSTGNLIRTTANGNKVFGTHAVFKNSSFTTTNEKKNLIVDLQLQDSIFARNIHIATSTEISMRN